MNSSFGVGVIGVGSTHSWAREAHVPAVQATEGLELVAIAARTVDRAAEVADELGVHKHYADAAELIADPDVQLVVIGAPVPAHAELITLATRAGKQTISEWPLGTSTAQTVAIAQTVTAAGLGGVVGLQARNNVAVVKAVELLRSGRVGRLLSLSMLATTAGWGEEIPLSAEYLEDPATGMNLTTIQTAHAIDLAILLGGDLVSVSATTSTQYPQVHVTGTDRMLRRTVPDHVLVHGHLAGDVPLAIEVRGGVDPHSAPFRMEIRGNAGHLELAGGAARGFQAGDLTVYLDGQEIEIDRPFADLPESARNVAGLYTTLVHDLRNETTQTASFDHAVALSRLIDDLSSAAEHGTTIADPDRWPTRGWSPL